MTATARNMRRDRELVKRTPHGVEGTWATEIIEDLGAREDEIHVIKHRYSSFFQTDLDLVLKDMLVDQLVVFGVVTNICVRSTVHDAFFNGYEVVVPRDCCAATGPREQEIDALRHRHPFRRRQRQPRPSLRP